MKRFICKCGSKEIFTAYSENRLGVYCANCGKLIEWLNKDNQKLAERQIRENITNRGFYLELSEMLFKANNAFLDHCLTTDCESCKYNYLTSTSCDNFFIADYIMTIIEERFYGTND